MLLPCLLIILAILFLAIKIFSYKSKCAKSQIRGAFVIPGYPLVGNTFQLLNNPSKTFMEWREKYNQSTFVIYLGSTPVLIVNDRNDIEYLWSHHSTALNSRPTSHTFHNVISATQGPTIGTTPAGSSFRKKRKVLSMHLSVKSLTTQINVEALDQCSQYIIRNILIETTKLNPMRYPFSDISLLRHFQCYVLSCAIKLTYGISLDTHVKDRQLANKIIETENHIINFRSFISNYQDYLPIFRIFPFNMVVNNDANFWKTERDKYIDQLQAEFENQLHGNIYPSCKSILAQIMSERAGARTLNQQETRSLCLTMISAGLDNLGFTMNYIVGQLAGSENGYKMQERLFWELMSASDDDIVQAWKNSACHMNCDYALAIIQEALRKFSVLPLGLPRLTTKSVQFGDIAIPKDTVLFMNVFAANHDPSMCQMPDAFQPQRWLDSNGKLIKSSEMIQFTFGLGSRKCAGDRLSIKEMYTLLCRLVLVFHIRRPRDLKWLMESDPFLSNANPAATSIEPKQCRVWLRARQGKGIAELHRQIL